MSSRGSDTTSPEATRGILIGSQHDFNEKIKRQDSENAVVPTLKGDISQEEAMTRRGC
jgi:hypothetical protein